MAQLASVIYPFPTKEGVAYWEKGRRKIEERRKGKKEQIRNLEEEEERKKPVTVAG